MGDILFYSESLKMMMR